MDNVFFSSTGTTHTHNNHIPRKKAPYWQKMD